MVDIITRKSVIMLTTFCNFVSVMFNPMAVFFISSVDMRRKNEIELITKFKMNKYEEK